jgi:hypothetical protein
VVILVSNRAKLALAEGLINYGQLGTNQGTPHTFKMILMDSTFVFSKTESEYLSDVESHALSEINGYSAKTLNPLTLILDEDNNLNITYPTISWTAIGGSIGPFSGALIYDNNGALNSQKVIIAYFLLSTQITIEIENSFALYYGLIRI